MSLDCSPNAYYEAMAWVERLRIELANCKPPYIPAVLHGVEFSVTKTADGESR